MKLTRIIIVSKNTFAEIRDKYSVEMTEKELEAFNTNMKDTTLFVPMTRNDDEEICFFKEYKPQLFSKLIYYSEIYKIETNRPTGSDTAQKNYT